ncbi:RNA ligase [Helicobacter sp. 23-1048]
MRTLVLLRGIPASGKSSWLKEHNLELYALSPDSLRLSLASPILGKNGTYTISQDNDKTAWKLLFEILESRMKNGELSIIDATHISAKAIRAYEDLAEKYRYHIVVVDFSDITLQEALKHNANREYKRVSDTIITTMHERLIQSLQNPLPKRYQIIKPSEIHKLLFTPIDLNAYKKIHHIGDLQGCYTVIVAYLQWQCKNHHTQSSGQITDYKALLNPDEYYIFCGDYIDRGIENAQVVALMLAIMDLPNVCLLEGNHERWLRKWGEEQIQTNTQEQTTQYSNEFAHFTLKELKDSHITQKDARNLTRKLRQCAFYDFKDKRVLATHGGLASLPENLTLISTRGLIYGSGGYSDVNECTKNWKQNTPAHCFQVFGHRNREKLPMRVNERCFVLEGGVEFGGELRIATLEGADSHKKQESTITLTQKSHKEPQKELSLAITHTIHRDGWGEVRITNPVHRNNADFQNTYAIIELIQNLRKSAFVREKQYFDGRICSFNFNQKVFYTKAWNDLTCKARGLFIDVLHNKVVARSFDKFFNLNEVPKTRLENLKELCYPLKCFVKENGFLGILSVDSHTNEFLITSKSDPTSAFSGYFKEILFNSLNDEARELLKNAIVERDISLVFEVIDPIRDPHIIAYDTPKVILLDGFANALQTRRIDFRYLCDLAKKLGIEHKAKVCEISDFGELQSFIDKVQAPDFMYSQKDFQANFETQSDFENPAQSSDKEEAKRHIEGFVIEDKNGFMFKLKLPYYTMWKGLRNAVEKSLDKQQMVLPAFIHDKQALAFWAYLSELVEREGFSVLANNIITLREKFFKQM